MSSDTAEKVERLRHLRTLLKSGEYDGMVVMQAWIAIDEYADLLERTAHNTTQDQLTCTHAVT